MSELREAMEQYLDLRRKLGSKLCGADGILRSFLAFPKREDASHLTTHLAPGCTPPASPHDGEWRGRLDDLRPPRGHRHARKRSIGLKPGGRHCRRGHSPHPQVEVRQVSSCPAPCLHERSPATLCHGEGSPLPLPCDPGLFSLGTRDPSNRLGHPLQLCGGLAADWY